MKSFRPNAVIHLAAESHVDNSIQGPEPFIQSNVVGTFNILEECRQLWMQEPEEFANARFLHVSTDEVYGELEEDGYFTEQTPMHQTHLIQPQKQLVILLFVPISKPTE